MTNQTVTDGMLASFNNNNNNNNNNSNNNNNNTDTSVTMTTTHSDYHTSSRANCGPCLLIIYLFNVILTLTN